MKLQRLKQLLFAHLVAVTCCAAMADIDGGTGVQAGINMLFTALVGSDLCLLGMGMAAVAEWPPRKRASLLAKSTGWIWLVTFIVMIRARYLPPAFVLLLPLLVSSVAFGFGIGMRIWHVRLVSAADAFEGAAEPFQFTLRHLLMWVSTLAVLLAVARGLHSTASLHIEGKIAYTVAVLAVMSLLTAGIVLATLWATLGAGRPVARLPMAVSLAAIGGLAPAYCFKRPDPWAYVGLAIVAAGLSTITAASLLVVRRCDYRLVVERAVRHRDD